MGGIFGGGLTGLLGGGGGALGGLPMGGLISFINPEWQIGGDPNKRKKDEEEEQMRMRRRQSSPPWQQMVSPFAAPQMQQMGVPLGLLGGGFG
jgi:hypothetical protein